MESLDDSFTRAMGASEATYRRYPHGAAWSAIADCDKKVWMAQKLILWLDNTFT